MKLQLSSHNVFHIPHDGLSADIASKVVHATRSLVDAPTLVERAAASSSSCTSADNCKTPAQTENTTNIIIGLTVAIPVAAAIITLFFLHRRVKRRQRLEDANDKHKSLDFGMEDVVSKRGGREAKLPEMTITDMEKSTMDMMHKKGMSLDMKSPYLLPAAVNGSRESFHSMSRSLVDGEDPYRPVTMAMSDTSGARGSSRPLRDNDSVYTGSSVPSGDAMKAGLLVNASRMSHSDPFASPQDEYPPPSFQETAQPQRRPVPAANAYPPREGSIRSPIAEVSQAPVVQQPIVPAVSIAAPEQYDEPLHVTPPSPPAHQRSHPASANPGLTISVPPIPDDEPELETNKRLSTAQPDARRVSVAGLRPLPPDDPADNPEQRANRIRSFYKEYFDESKPNPTGFYPQYNPYADDYEAEFFEDGAAMYDPDTGAFITGPSAPFAAPMQRNAFTPPPGGAPRTRVRSNTSLQSTGHINNPAFNRGPRAPPKKQLPPPVALKSLPTPHMLQGNDMAFLDSIQFAPKPSHRDQQLGRGTDSPTGTMRPYSPAVRVASPLVRSFDELAAIPSPHLLRKSGTFTSLDFAPPPRFRNADGGGSDAGSIRSNRSGISQLQNYAIRNGAYRVSRLPQQMVGTRDDLAMALKPSWELRGVNPGST